ncbi:oligosaccharide flippase family protein [Brevibacterium sp. PAMC21349]|nr:oligosaccharide flippase family protein [Brevibacterium sp. PAMC21349]
MNRNKRLAFNTFLYFIGNLSSRLLGFFLLPVYTTYLSPKDYGEVDLIFTYTSILIPLFTLQISFAGVRFLFETENVLKKKEIVSNSFFIHMLGMIIFVFLYTIFWLITGYEYGIYVLIYVLLNSLVQILQQLLRGLRENVIFTISGTIGTAVQLSANILFIVGLGLKSIALLLSPIISFIIIILMIIIKTDIKKYISFHSINKIKLFEMLKYSIPLIPDAICWWVLMGFGRIFLNSTHGPDSVGIYAVANKFPGLITTLYSVFNLAWQENSFVEYDKADRDRYYSSIYNGMLKFILPIIIVLIPFINIVSPFLLGESFEESYLYIPILLIGALFNIMSTFYGSGFESAKQTKGIMVSTFIAMATNVFFTYLLVPKYSILGVSIAFVLSYFVLLIIRVIRSKKFFSIKVEFGLLMISSLLLIVSLIVFYLGNIALQFTLIIIGLTYFFFINKSLVSSLIKKLTYRR